MPTETATTPKGAGAAPLWRIVGKRPCAGRSCSELILRLRPTPPEEAHESIAAAKCDRRPRAYRDASPRCVSQGASRRWKDEVEQAPGSERSEGAQEHGADQKHG